MTALPTNGAQLYDAPVFNAQVPKEGPKACPVAVPFSQGVSFSLNLLLTQSQQFMSMVQAIFVDNEANPDKVTITSGNLKQGIVIPAGHQGYVPLLVVKNDTLTFLSEGGVDIRVILLNVPVPACVWNATATGAEYIAVAASQADLPLGTNGGAVGDYIEGLLIVPATSTPGAVSLVDGANTLDIFAGGASSVSNLVPFWVPLGVSSQLAGWEINTGANVSVIAVGQFT